MIMLTAPMVKKLDQILAGGGGGGGGGSTDLTPVLDAIAAIPAPSGGNVDLTPVLNAVAAVDSKAVALQNSVAAIPGGGGGSTDLTPVLDAIAALPAPSGGSVDLTPVLNAVAAVDSKAVALQTSVAAIPTTGGGSAGSPIKSIQRLNIASTVLKGTTVAFPIATIDPAKTMVNTISFAAFIVSTLNLFVDADQIRIVNTSGSTDYTPILKMEIVEYV